MLFRNVYVDVVCSDDLAEGRDGVPRGRNSTRIILCRFGERRVTEQWSAAKPVA